MKYSTLLAASAMCFSASAQIIDGGFENASVDTVWQQFSLNFGTPLCDGGCSNNDPDFVAHNGDWFVWFGGTASTGSFPEVGFMIQEITIPVGTTASVSAWVRIQQADASGIDSLVFGVDSIAQIITMADAPAYAQYTQSSIDVSAFADGLTHLVFVSGIQHAGAAPEDISNVFVDDMELTVDGNVVAGFFENEARPGFNVYPNPSNDRINISFNAMHGAAALTITNMAGQVVERHNVREVERSIVSFNCAGLPNGVYMVNVDQSGASRQQRVVVAH